MKTRQESPHTLSLRRVSPAQVGMMQMLRSGLAKSAKESAMSIPCPTPAKDTLKLKKHVGLVLERLAKGMRMNLEPDDQTGGQQGSASLGRSRSSKQAATQ